jgi:hypothetical protein
MNRSAEMILNMRKFAAMALLLMLPSESANAIPKAWCGNTGGSTGIPMLEEIKRQFWTKYPADLARQRTRETVQAFVEFARDWETDCCTLPRAECRALADRDIRVILQWDWQTPPK